MKFLWTLVLALVYTCASFGQPQSDWRRFSEGHEIPDEEYSDQPYVVVTKDNVWLCTLTTGSGREGAVGQHIVSTRSTDMGKTWSPLVDIEPASGPEASWVMPVLNARGRVYVFYTYNKDNIRDSMPIGSDAQGAKKRVDTFGGYAYKYSDDGGKSWSKDRSYIPMHALKIEYKNPLGPSQPLFWGIGKPIVDRGDVFLGAAKIAYFGRGFMAEDRGVVFRSPNLLTEDDPRKHRWYQLPEGHNGLGSVMGPVSDEHNLVALSDGSLYAMARTIEGHPVHYYSHDRGKTWSAPEYATYTPGGQKFRHPRACPRVWKTTNGKFLFWFHNNGHKWYASDEALTSRNIAWLSAGVEKNGQVYWSQPEVVRYVDSTAEGASYPDLIEQGGRYFIAATQKTSARVNEIPKRVLEMMWDQPNRREVSRDGLLADLDASHLNANTSITMPKLSDLRNGGGFTIDLTLQMAYAEPNQVLLDSRTATSGAGIVVRTGRRHTLQIEINDGERSFLWDSDPGTVGPDRSHNVSFIVDGGPKMIAVVVDGKLCDGGESDERKFGYGRFVQSLYPSKNPNDYVVKTEMGNVSGASQARLLTSVAPQTYMQRLRIYNRALLVTECVGNHRASDGK